MVATRARSPGAARRPGPPPVAPVWVLAVSRRSSLKQMEASLTYNLLLMLVAQMSTYPRAIATHYCSWGSSRNFKLTHGALTNCFRGPWGPVHSLAFRGFRLFLGAASLGCPGPLDLRVASPVEKMVRYFALAARGGQPRPRSRDSPAAPSTALHVPACSPERHPRRAAGLS